MKGMTDDLSLPRLQAHLDRMRRDQSLTLARSHVERLFGDLPESQLDRFAKSHRCIIAHSDNCVVFQKIAPST